MSAHGSIINEEGLRVLGQNVSRITQGILLTVGFVSTIFTLAGEYSHGEHYLQTWLVENVAIMGAMLHLILVLLILFPGRLRKMNSDVKDPTVQAVIQCLNNFFIPAWTWIWVFFGLLYAVYLFRTMAPETGHAIHMNGAAYTAITREHALMDTFNVGSTLFIALIYNFLTPSFLRRYVMRARRITEETWRHRTKRRIYKALFRIGIKSARRRAYLAGRRRVVCPERANSWVAWKVFLFSLLGACLLITGILCIRLNLLSFANPEYWEKFIELVLGFTSALALAAFAGRIDSQFIRNWQWIIPFLFLYASLQTYTSVLYEDVKIDRAVFTYAAFTLKCLLFIFVSNFFEDRKAIYYAYENVDVADKRVI